MERPSRIVLAVRVGSESFGPGRTAAWLADRLGAELTLVYVATELETVTEVAVDSGIREEEVRARIVEGARERAESWGSEALDGHPFLVRIEEGDVAERVAAVTAELEAELVVVGTEARSAIRDILLGDTTRAILRRAPCPVVVVPAPGARD